MAIVLHRLTQSSNISTSYNLLQLDPQCVQQKELAQPPFQYSIYATLCGHLSSS